MHENRSNLHDLSPINAQQDKNDNDNHDDLDLSLHLYQPPPPPTPSSPSPSLTPNPTVDFFPFPLNPSLNHTPIPTSPTPNPSIDFFPLPLNPSLNHTPTTTSSTPNPTIEFFPLPPLNLSLNHTPNATSPTENPNPSIIPTSRSSSPVASPVARTQRREFLGLEKPETIPAPYPWAKNQRAVVRSMQNLVENEVLKIVGKMKCSKCEEESEIEYDLVEKFKEVERFIETNKFEMSVRAPAVWDTRKQLDCKSCRRECCVKPVIGKKRDINWLFLLLGQMVGFCTLEQLKYFCKHTRNHRSGGRDRLLYITYLSLCNQLNPNGQYHHF